MQPGQHRETARVILCKPSGEVFLIKTHFDPEIGLPPRWLTPGGGIEDGESIAEAARRELLEETGLELSVEAIGQLVWQTTGRWAWSDQINHHTYVDYFFLHQLSERESQSFELNTNGWTQEEHRDVVEHRWWNLHALKESGESVGPPDLVEFLLNHLPA